MNGFRAPRAAVVFLAGLAWAGAAVAQWEPTARLGLSASPESYVPTIAPMVGEGFALHVILTSMADDVPLPFSLDAVTWLVHTECCGDSPVGVTSLAFADGITATGDPYEAVTTTLADCPDTDTVLLATARFEWLLEGQAQFLLSAGAITAALACDGSAHLLQTLTVSVEGQDPTPVASSTWSGVKSLFGDEGRTP